MNSPIEYQSINQSRLMNVRHSLERNRRLKPTLDAAHGAELKGFLELVLGPQFLPKLVVQRQVKRQREYVVSQRKIQLFKLQDKN